MRFSGVPKSVIPKPWYPDASSSDQMSYEDGNSYAEIATCTCGKTARPNGITRGMAVGGIKDEVGERDVVVASSNWGDRSLRRKIERAGWGDSFLLGLIAQMR